MLLIGLGFVSGSLFTEEFCGQCFIYRSPRCECTSKLGWSFDWPNHNLSVLILDKPDSACRRDMELETIYWPPRPVRWIFSGNSGV